MILAAATHQKYFGTSVLDAQAEVDANNNTIYEGVTSSGNSTSATTWVICKHTYDANNNYVSTQFYVSANGSPLAAWTNRHTLLP